MIDESKLYLVTFFNILNRNDASITIVDREEIVQLQKQQVDHVFEDGDIVNVNSEYGIAFHNPRKAFNFINHEAYFASLGVS